MADARFQAPRLGLGGAHNGVPGTGTTSPISAFCSAASYKAAQEPETETFTEPYGCRRAAPAALFLHGEEERKGGRSGSFNV
ncbi:hypothetical protein MRX96_006552 [Rhipicephalus microplus]